MSPRFLNPRKLGVSVASWLKVEGLVLECTAAVCRYLFRPRALLSSLVSVEAPLVWPWFSDAGVLIVVRWTTLVVASTPLETAASIPMALKRVNCLSERTYRWGFVMAIDKVYGLLRSEGEDSFSYSEVLKYVYSRIYIKKGCGRKRDRDGMIFLKRVSLMQPALRRVIKPGRTCGAYTYGISELPNLISWGPVSLYLPRLPTK